MDFLKDLFGGKERELSKVSVQPVCIKIQDALSTRSGSSNADELDIKRERKKMKAINSSNADELERIKK